MSRENLIGQKFQMLTVIDFAPDYISPKGHRIPQWLCRCECGAEVVTRGSSLKSGHIKSCGKKHRRVQDMTGQKFGKLTVVSRADDYINADGTKHVMWLCKCECGNEIVTRGTSLRNGHTQSCGCLHSESMMGIGLQDITGQVFGRWTVLYENGRLKEPRGRLVPLWHCRCECGEERDLRAGTLKQGLSLSCGCYKHDALKEKAANGFGISKAERIVNEYLKLHGVYYENQKIYPNLRGLSGYPLSYDFLVYRDGIPDFLIECQGKQHYEPVAYFGGEKQFLVQQDNDKRKRQYAIQLGLPLLEIPYTCDKDSIIRLLDMCL